MTDYHRSGIFPYYKVSLYHIVPAIILGALCQHISQKVQDKYDLKPLYGIIFQISLMIAILYTIEVHVSLLYSSQWQSITPGLFFVSIFFGLQSSLYDNIIKII